MQYVKLSKDYSYSSIFLLLRLKAIQSAFLACAVVLASFVWQGNIGFNIADEGFLWYGVQRVMLGEVPIRDFMAYDPGRYYWSAVLMSLCNNNSIIALRGVVTIFQAIGLFVGLLLIAHSVKKQNFLYLLISAITLLAWMFPRHKLFDISLSIFLIGALAFLVQKPTSRHYFVSGLCVGLVAFFGRNHGIFGVAGSFGVMLWLIIKRVESHKIIRGFTLWAIGVTIGFSFIIFMALLVPGFAIAFWESLRFLFELKTTNIPLPVPWPWRVNFSAMPLEDTIRGLLIGFFFIATIVFGTLSIAWAVLQKLQKKQISPALVAASFLALPYAYFAYSRADVGHLAQGIFPLLIGCLVLLATQPAKIKWPLSLILCTSSLWLMHVFHPGWQCHASKQWVNIEISGSNLVVDPDTANDYIFIRRLVDQYAPDGRSFIITPFWPGAYALLERKSPIWEIYALFPRSETFQKAEIERIKAAKPGFALVIDLSLDGRDELRFQNTHPLIYQYILDHFDRVPYSHPVYQIYKAKLDTYRPHCFIGDIPPEKIYSDVLKINDKLPPPRRKRMSPASKMGLILGVL
jgi:hypothetical protein